MCRVYKNMISFIPAEHIISVESLVRHTNLFNLKKIIKKIDVFCKISQDPQFDSLALLLWPQHLSNGLNMTIKAQNAVMGRPTINSLKGKQSAWLISRCIKINKNQMLQFSSLLIKKYVVWMRVSPEAWTFCIRKKH